MVDLIWDHFKMPPINRDLLPEQPLEKWADLADRYDMLREEVRAEVFSKGFPYGDISSLFLPDFCPHLPCR